MKNLYNQLLAKLIVLKTYFLILTLVLISFAFQNTFAQKTWTGAESTVWSNASNWDPASVPAKDDDILIPDECNFYPIITADRETGTLSIQSNASLTINSGKFEVKNGTKNLDNNGTLTMSGGELVVEGIFTNHTGANLYTTGGKISGDITNYGTLTSSSGSSILDGIIANQSGGTLNINGGSLEIKQEPSTNAGSINVSSGSLFFNGKDLDNLPGGTITQTGGTLELDHLTNNGQVTASNGTFTIDGFFTNYAGKNINVNGGSVIVKNNTSINSGSITVSSGLLDFGTAGKDLTINAGGSLTQTGGAVKVKNLTVNATGSYTFSGTTLDITGDLTNSGTVTLNPGTVNVNGQIKTEIGSELTIAGATVTANDNATFKGLVNISDGTFDLGTNNKAAFVDGATFNQTGGTIITEDLELKNGATYSQSGGEVQIDHDLKIPPGTTFASTGGTVRFTGDQGGGADYSGNVQFFDVIIESGGKLNMDKDEDNIKIAGNFTNYNPNLDNEKGTVTFNGTSPQTISSATTPASSKTTFGNLIITNPSGVTLSTDVGVKTSFSYNSGGYLNLDGNTLYVNGSEYTGPLPVELISFSATRIGSAVKLSWNTATEINNYGFEILRQAQDDNEWINIGFVNGNGNSNSPKNYSFEDKNVSAGKFSYRLKQIDNDGQFEYSKTIGVNFGSPKKFELSHNYPNPFNPSTTIRFSLPEASNVKLTIYNILGQEIKLLVSETKEAGVYTINFSADDLDSGVYIYRIETGSFTQTKKMTLVK